MGLSSDPEKRARQIENLRGGPARAAAKHGRTKPEESAAPEPNDLEVIDYPADEPKPEPEAPPEPKPAARRRAAKPKRRPEPRPDPRPEPEPEPEPDGGFWSGFFG